MNLEKYYPFLENQVYTFWKYKHVTGFVAESLADGKKISVSLKVMWVYYLRFRFILTKGENL
jgi:hypothetical protein